MYSAQNVAGNRQRGLYRGRVGWTLVYNCSASSTPGGGLDACYADWFFLLANNYFYTHPNAPKNTIIQISLSKNSETRTIIKNYYKRIMKEKPKRES